jgi:large subunit ribosomal protein L10
VVAEKKRKIVNTIVELALKYPVMGLLELNKLPAPQMQIMRDKLRDIGLIKVVKKRLIKKSLEILKEKKEGVEQLSEYLPVQPALIFTDTNPFKLTQILDENKAPAPARPGEVAPKDILVKTGNTGIAPGPFLGTLQKFGIKTKIQEGKIHILTKKVVCKSGEIVSPELAELLSKLNILPFEAGLDLTAIYEDGLIFDKKILSINPQDYINQIQIASKEALSLGINAIIYNQETIPTLLSSSEQATRNLAINSGIFVKEVMPDFIGLANTQMLALASKLLSHESALDDELKTLLSSGIETKPQKKEIAPKKKEEKKEEQDETVGLASLFG